MATTPAPLEQPRSPLSAPGAPACPQPRADLAARACATASSAADEVVAALVAAGVDTFFGVPGGPIIPVFDAVLRTPSARLIESRSETGAAFAAIGFWRATGRVPAVVVTAGPGATNVVTGVASAHLERVPMLVLCGDVAATAGRLLQDSGLEGIAIESMLAHLTRATVRVAAPRSAASQAIAALHAATQPARTGPALLVLPIDRSVSPAAVTRTARPTIAHMAHPPADAVRDAAALLAAAERPLIVIGAGCRPYAEQVRRLIDVLDLPFMTTPQGKGIVSEAHPCSLRHGGLASSLWARRYTAGGVDAALVLGTDLDDCAVGPTPPIGPGGRLIHVDLDATVFNRNWPTELGVLADVGAFVEPLRELISREGGRDGRGRELMREARREAAYDCPGFATDAATAIAPHRAIADLQRAAGPGATFVSDIGEHMLFALHYLTATGPGSFTLHLGLGSMASGICSAIGQALGDRTRRVICICGDGGMQMVGMELLVAIRERLPLVYAIFNDARYNMVYHGYRQLFDREAAWSTAPIDFALWARALGIPGVRVERPGQITARLLDELTAPGLPVVLDIRHDPDVRVRGAGRVEALQRMSMAPREAAT